MSAIAIRYGLVALIVAGTIGGIYFKGRADGHAIEQARIAEEIEKARKERANAEDNTRRLTDDELFDRLRPRR